MNLNPSLIQIITPKKRIFYKLIEKYCINKNILYFTTNTLSYNSIKQITINYLLSNINIKNKLNTYINLLNEDINNNNLELNEDFIDILSKIKIYPIFSIRHLYHVIKNGKYSINTDILIIDSFEHLLYELEDLNYCNKKFFVNLFFKIRNIVFKKRITAIFYFMSDSYKNIVEDQFNKKIFIQ